MKLHAIYFSQSYSSPNAFTGSISVSYSSGDSTTLNLTAEECKSVVDMLLKIADDRRLRAIKELTAASFAPALEHQPVEIVEELDAPVSFPDEQSPPPFNSDDDLPF